MYFRWGDDGGLGNSFPWDGLGLPTDRGRCEVGYTLNGCFWFPEKVGSVAFYPPEGKDYTLPETNIAPENSGFQ